MKAIDIVCNLWTEEIARRYPEQMLLSWKLLRMGNRAIGTEPEAMVHGMDAAGVDVALLIAATGGSWEVRMEEVLAVIEKYPDRFRGLMGLNPMDGMKSVRALDRAVREYGFVGGHLYPHWFKLPPNHANYYPLYAKCAELGVPVQMQIGHATPGSMLPSVAKPILLEEIAIHFPELKILGIHVGYPWTEEMISVAFRFPNVYIGTDAHSPKYWEPSLVHFINTRGQDKVLFGTDFPVLDFERTMKEIDALDLRPEARRKLVRDNALAVYGLSHG